jgi:dTDP-glucose 4,6-dehydratase
MKILVTGGAGFIGSAVIRNLIIGGRDEVINVDKLTYAANLDSLAPVDRHPGYTFEQVDICDAAAVKGVFMRHQPDAVMHLAAESHVDRSIDGPANFVQTNIIGTYNMLEVALNYSGQLDGISREQFRFHHISTDEVFGSLGHNDPPFTKNTPYKPRSPYSATKAASDHLALAWYHTYGLPVVLSNCSNNYGPFQFPEKLIPLMIINAMSGQALPVYGRGENIRDWLHVDDHAAALVAIMKRGRLGECYLVGGDAERRNVDVVREICRYLDTVSPRSDGSLHESLINFVQDRPGHDFRYSINCAQIKSELGWKPEVNFEEGLAQTIDWYIHNREWWEPRLANQYDGRRLGLARSERR